MSTRFTLPRWQVADAGGLPLAGAKLYAFISGTSTPKATYTDAALTTPHPHPIVADAAGRFPDIYPEEGLYRLRLETATNVVVWDADPVDGKASGLSSYLPRDGSLPMTGALKVAAGDTHGIRVDGNTGVWIRRPTAMPDVMELGTGGAARLTLTNTGLEAHQPLTVAAATAAGHAPRWEQVRWTFSSETALSGSAVDFTSIPDGAMEILVLTREATLSSASEHLIAQIGAGTSPVTSGYVSLSVLAIASTSSGGVNLPSGFGFWRYTGAIFVTGAIYLTRAVAQGRWYAQCSGAASSAAGLTGTLCGCTGGGFLNHGSPVNVVRLRATGAATLSGGHATVAWR